MARSFFRASKWKFRGNGGRTKLKSDEEFGESGLSANVICRSPVR